MYRKYHVNVMTPTVLFKLIDMGVETNHRRIHQPPPDSFVEIRASYDEYDDHWLEWRYNGRFHRASLEDIDQPALVSTHNDLEWRNNGVGYKRVIDGIDQPTWVRLADPSRSRDIQEWCALGGRIVDGFELATYIQGAQFMWWRDSKLHRLPINGIEQPVCIYTYEMTYASMSRYPSREPIDGIGQPCRVSFL